MKRPVLYFHATHNFVRPTLFTTGHHILCPERIDVSSITLYVINININIIHPSVTRSTKINPFLARPRSVVCKIGNELHGVIS
jgi:hypothetical protein